MNFVGVLVFTFFLSIVASANVAKEKVYKEGRAFPSRSLEYVKRRFDEVNQRLVWDPKNYMEKMAADFASCKYEGGIVEGYALSPLNNSYVAFVEYEPLEGHTTSFVNKHLKVIIDKWVEKKLYNTQIIGASRFGCSVNPGCGYNEPRMSVSCVFTPSSPKYIPTPEDYEDENDNSQNDQEQPSQPEGLTDEQYQAIKSITGSNCERVEFLENLSILETSCAMLNDSDWKFSNAFKVVSGLDVNVYGFYGRAPISESGSVTEAVKQIMHTLKKAKKNFPRNMQIGCSIIQDCKEVTKERIKTWAIMSCLYEEKTRAKYCV